MRLEEVKTVAKALTELSECQKDLFTAVKSTGRQAAATQKLWREGNKSRLVKIGIALIVFPEPTSTSDIVGACFVAAGAIQQGMQHRSLYMEDVSKTFKGALKEVIAAKHSLHI